jgi:hypothetical protein
MSHRSFSFSAGHHKIKVSLEEVVPGKLIVEVLNPWFERECATVVAVDDFLSDINKVIPDTVADSVEDALMPLFAKMISDHLSEYGRLTDADFCLYMAYYYMVRDPLAKLTGDLELNKDDTMMSMRMVCRMMKDQGLRLTRTKFSEGSPVTWCF